MPKVRKKKRGSRSILGKIDLREIELTAMNTQSIYKQADALALNYAIKLKRGTYNRRKAIQGVANLIAPKAIKKAGITARTSSADKKKVGQILLGWITEMRDDIIKHQPSRLPKKYQKKIKKRKKKR